MSRAVVLAVAVVVFVAGAVRGWTAANPACCCLTWVIAPVPLIALAKPDGGGRGAG